MEATAGTTEQQETARDGSAGRPATLCEAFQRTISEIPDSVALRSADGQTQLTWAEYGEQVEQIAAGLAALGVGAGDAVGLMLVNRPEFNLVDTAAFHLGATPFSIYNTSAPQQTLHVLENSGAEFAVTETALLPAMLAGRELLDRELTIVCIDGSDEAQGVISLEELKGRAGPEFDFEADWRAVKPDDVLTLIYTSGTTGPPKGVELTHANLIAQCFGVAELLPVERGDRTTSYLPSAHIADRWASHYHAMVFGIEVTTVPDPRAVAAALPEVRPTLWGAVPRVLEKMAAALEAGIAGEDDPERKAGIEAAIAVGKQKVALEQEGKELPEELAAKHAMLDEKVLSVFRQKMGLDQVKWIVVGAAPIPKQVQEFLMAIGLPLTEVYGMSELSCIVTTAPVEEAKIGSVGRAIPGVEISLAEDGELLARGPTAMKGYRNDPEKTAEIRDSEGWIHTGDIATIDDDGYAVLIDRKKELIINAAGKNMSPANIEKELKTAHALIGQAICIGDQRPYNVALLVLDPDAVAARAKAEGREPSVAEFAADLEIRKEIEAAVEEANSKLSRVEQVKTFELLAEEWLPGGDELTPTMKLKRKPIGEKYSEVIERLYA
jgi:long-chain acyl-CoA synthetase